MSNRLFLPVLTIALFLSHLKFAQADATTLPPLEPLKETSLESNIPVGNWGSVDVHLLNKQTIEQIFNELKNRSEFAWDYPTDQCYAKAYLSSYLLRQAGIKSFTAWVLAPQEAPLLRVETLNAPKGCTNWIYHVAAGVAGLDPNGEVQGWIMDPALANQPIKLWDWVSLMTAHYKNNETPIVWTSHPFTFRKEDLGQPQSNVLLARADFSSSIVSHYRQLLLKDKKIVQSPAYQQRLSKMRELAAEGKNPAHQIPDPCGGFRNSKNHFEFLGLIDQTSLSR